MIAKMRLNHRHSAAASSHESDSPFIAARREWNERYGDYIAQAKNWRLAAILSLAISAILAVGAIWLAAQTKFVPYVVEVDKLGAAVAISRADRATFTPDQRIVRAQLAQWISDARSVSSDPAAERTALTRVYSMIATSAKPYLDDWYRAHSPFEAGARETVAVTVDAVLPQSDRTFQLQWTEVHRPLNSAQTTTMHWISQVTVGINPPSDEATILHNPLGLYVTDLTWTQRI
jgi:type IV secretion system protein VirB5